MSPFSCQVVHFFTLILATNEKSPSIQASILNDVNTLISEGNLTTLLQMMNATSSFFALSANLSNQTNKIGTGKLAAIVTFAVFTPLLGLVIVIVFTRRRALPAKGCNDDFSLEPTGLIMTFETTDVHVNDRSYDFRTYCTTECGPDSVTLMESNTIETNMPLNNDGVNGLDEVLIQGRISQHSTYSSTCQFNRTRDEIEKPSDDSTSQKMSLIVRNHDSFQRVMENGKLGIVMIMFVNS
jgi:hypothetical protein